MGCVLRSLLSYSVYRPHFNFALKTQNYLIRVKKGNRVRNKQKENAPYRELADRILPSARSCILFFFVRLITCLVLTITIYFCGYLNYSKPLNLWELDKLSFHFILYLIAHTDQAALNMVIWLYWKENLRSFAFN